MVALALIAACSRNVGIDGLCCMSEIDSPGDSFGGIKMANQEVFLGNQK
jgi:hypothetical protein